MQMLNNNIKDIKAKEDPKSKLDSTQKGFNNTMSTTNILEELNEIESGDDMEDFLNEHKQKMQDFQKSMEDISRSKNRIMQEINNSVDDGINVYTHKK